MARIIGLNHFQIKGNGSPADQHICRVFRNDVQQFSVTFIIDAYGDNGVVIPLTQAQLESVKLVKYDGGEVTGLFQNHTKNVFDYYPDSYVRSNETINQNMSNIDFYYAVNSGSTFSSLQLAAQITLDGATYTTNLREANPGGAISNGGFNSSIVVEPVATRKLSAADLQIVYAGGIPHEADFPIPMQIFKWEITFLDGNRQIRSTGTYPSDPIDVPIDWFAQWIGDDDRVAYYNASVRDVGSMFRGKLPVPFPDGYEWRAHPYTKNGVAYALMLDCKLLIQPHYTSTNVTYYDQNGNRANVWLKPDDCGQTFKIVD